MEERDEKRKAPRVKTHIPLRFRRLKDGAGMAGTISISKNLSEGGVRFLSDSFVSRACRLILELDVPMFSKPIKAISKVAWIRKAENGNEYEVGNRFLEMTREDKELIAEYVDSLVLYRDIEEMEVSSEFISGVE